MRHPSLPIAALVALMLSFGALPASALAQFATSDASLTLPGSADLQVRSIQWGAGRCGSGTGGAAAPTRIGTLSAPSSTLKTRAPARDPGEVAEPVREESIEHLYFEHSIKTAREVASGQASGKRVQEPTALSNGSVTLRLASPWTACAAGDRFDGVYLTIGTTHKYRLDGLEVSACSAEQVSFNYAKVERTGS
jgi:hypothetical protein